MTIFLQRLILIFLFFLASNSFSEIFNENNEDFLIDIPIEVESSSKNVFLIDLYTGINENSSQKFKVLFESGSTHLILSNSKCTQCSAYIRKYDTSKSEFYTKTSTSLKISYSLGQVSGFKSYDYIGFSGMKSVKMPFVLCDVFDLSTYDGILGSLHNHYEEYDIITQLYKSNIISNRLFSQYIISDTKGVMSIGEYPEILKNEIKIRGNEDFISFCNIPIEEKGWTCESDRITINEKEYKQQLKITFDTGSSRSISTSIYDLLLQTIFKPLIEKGDCIENNQNSLKYLFCNKDFIKTSNKEIIFHFQNEKFMLLVREAFTYYEQSEMYLLNFAKPINKENERFKENIIGMPIMKHFINIFDKESHKYRFVRIDTLVKNEEKKEEINEKPDTEKKEKVSKDAFDENGFLKKDFLERKYNEKLLLNNPDDVRRTSVLRYLLDAYYENITKYNKYKNNQDLRSILKSAILQMNNTILEKL